MLEKRRQEALGPRSSCFGSTRRGFDAPELVQVQNKRAKVSQIESNAKRTIGRAGAGMKESRLTASPALTQCFPPFSTSIA